MRIAKHSSNAPYGRAASATAVEYCRCCGPAKLLSRYSHVRIEATRRALDEIAARQRATDEKRREEEQRREQAAVVPESLLLQ
jgi:hypothetical protein